MTLTTASRAHEGGTTLHACVPHSQLHSTNAQSCAEKLAGKGVDIAIMNAGVFVGGPDDPLKGGAAGSPGLRCRTCCGLTAQDGGESGVHNPGSCLAHAAPGCLQEGTVHRQSMCWRGDRCLQLRQAGH